MGHGCTSIAVKHAFFPHTPKDPDWEQLVDNIELWAEINEDNAPPSGWKIPAWFTNQQNVPLGYGWEIKRLPSGGDWEQFVNYKDIYVSVLRKDDRMVYALNSSQYNNVGEIEMTYFSDDPNHLQDFLNDFFPGESYENDAAVQQWG